MLSSFEFIMTVYYLKKIDENAKDLNCTVVNTVKQHLVDIKRFKSENAFFELVKLACSEVKLFFVLVLLVA